MNTFLIVLASISAIGALVAYPKVILGIFALIVITIIFPVLWYVWLFVAMLAFLSWAFDVS